MGKKIPGKLVKWIAALIFIAFGIFGLYDSLPWQIWISPIILWGMPIEALLILIVYGLGRLNKIRKEMVGERRRKDAG